MRYGRLRYPSNLFSPQSIADFPLFRSLSPGSTNARVRLSLCVSSLKSFGGYGISTVCASTTPFGLALAPGLPWADEPSPRNLRFSAIMIPYSGILSRVQSTSPSDLASPRTRRSPTIPRGILSFGYVLRPVIFSAQGHSTSELLRTLSMSGCL